MTNRNRDAAPGPGAESTNHEDKVRAGDAAAPPEFEGTVPASNEDELYDTMALADLEATLENTRAELEAARERHLRLAAEFDNYRKRTERERAEAYTRAQADLVARLLDVVDDLGRVADFDESTPAAALLEGVQLVDRKLTTVLQSTGLKRTEAEGAVFDPAAMEALATVPAERPEDEDIVADVFQPGYTFKGHLIRPARVRVKKYEA